MALNGSMYRKWSAFKSKEFLQGKIVTNQHGSIVFLKSCFSFRKQVWHQILQNSSRMVAWAQCLWWSFPCLPHSCYLSISLAPKWVFIGCLSMESGRAGRFVLACCSCLPLGCCRCFNFFSDSILMKERAGGGDGWWLLKSEFSSVPITAVLGHKLWGAFSCSDLCLIWDIDCNCFPWRPTAFILLKN